MINVLINGINGKMGQEVLTQVKSNSDFTCICGTDVKTGEIQGIKAYSNPDEISEKIDVIIDFSIPKATLNILKYANKNHVPTVIATTGFSDDDLKIIENYSKTLPIFKSANMSYEINLMADLVANLATKLKNSDIEIVDTHHNRKIDSPSGTALILADSINKALDNSMDYEYNRHSKREKRSKNEIGIHSIRGGTEVGKHTVYFFGDNESFEITHTVNSRSIFAKGALKAAKFIINKPNGLYNMKDLI